MTSSLSTTMKAWQFTNASPTIEHNLKLNESAPLPAGSTSLKPDQVLVKVQITSLNPVDYKFAEIPYLGKLIVGSPSTPGMDFVGTVVAIGPNSKKVAREDLKVGQLVYGRLDSPTKFGSLAEYTIAPRRGCVPVPEGVSIVDAACVTSTGLTAYQSIVPKLKGETEGKRILINGGSGGVGTFAIQIAKILGCYVVTTCSTPNVELCRSLGADEVIDYKKTDVIAELKKMERFDLVVDNVGITDELYWASPSFTAPGTQFVQVGTGPVSVSFALGQLYKQFWPGFLGGGKRPWEFLPLVSKPEDYEQMGRWLREGKMRTVVDEIFGPGDDSAIRGYAKVRTGRARGKILVRITEA